jgi:hypothetical protein
MPNAQALARHWEANRELLTEAARNAGVDPAILVKISGFESGFDTRARPIDHRHPERNTVRQFDGTMALSSAYGLGQFTNDTWVDTIHRYGAKYGVADAANLSKAQANAPALRDDPRLQAAMLAEFTRDNVERGRRLGGVDADANVYALHNLGSGDGPRFLQALGANPTASVDTVLSARVISGNPALYGDGSRTLAEAYRVMGAKMDAYADYAGRIQDTTSTLDRQPAVPTAPHPSVQPLQSAQGSAAIYDEARRHFLDAGGQFEYGRGDIGRVPNRGGDGRTDQSRNERDLDGDGRKGVDCSSFVWRGLRNAGYDVPASPFTTHDLFNGHAVTPYSHRHFDLVAGVDARRDRGRLEAGDILLFKDRHGGGQHVGIFKGYDEQGHIRFIGSQTRTGPGEQLAKPGGYWNGQQFEIVGALRAKPEFQVRPPLHGSNTGTAAETPHVSPSTPTRPDTRSANAGRMLRPGDRGSAITTLQRRLFDLDYRRPNGKPLDIDGDFGTDTLFALKHFQREHGLQGKGVAGPKTEAALERAERTLISSPAHPHHALYAQTLDKVREAEKARGIAVGPHSERIAAALTVECIRKGIGQVDRVEINNEKTLVRGIHDRPGNAESGLGNTDMISLPRASSQSMMESSRQCHEAAIDASARSAATLQQHRQPATHAMVH